MPILFNCRVIYREDIYKVLSINPIFEHKKGIEECNIEKPKFIDCVVINIYGEILLLHDERHMFKFLLDKEE